MNTVNSIQYPSQQSLNIDQEDRLIEEAKRILYQRCRHQEDCFTDPQSVSDFLILRLGSKKREVFAVLFLTAQHQLIEYKELFEGSIDSCQVYPREVVREALALNAAAVILAHNHPSGRVEPSRSDRLITETITTALSHVDVRILDHFIIGGSDRLSFAESGYL